MKKAIFVWCVRFLALLCLLSITGARSLPQQELAKQILDTTGIKGGLIAHIGCGDGELTAALHINDSYLIHGLDIDAVDSIIRLQPVTAVPRAPGFVEGLTNLRGTVLLVVDLHKRFGLPARDSTKDTRIIVAEAAGNKVGMRVDAVLEVRRVPQAAIEPPSPLVATVDSAFVTGVAKVEEDRLIILLDLERVLAT